MIGYVSRPRSGRRKAQFSAIKLCNLFVAAAGLSACATPAVRERVVEVSKPVATHPVDPKDVPVAPGSLGKRPPTLQQAADKALSGWCGAVAYMLKADPLLRLSAGLPPVELGAYPECGER